MKMKKKLLIIGVWLLSFGLISIKPVSAQGSCQSGSNCSACSFQVFNKGTPAELIQGDFDTIRFSFKPEDKTSQYIIESDGMPWPVQAFGRFRSGPLKVDSEGFVSIDITKDQAIRLFNPCWDLPPPVGCTEPNHFLAIKRVKAFGEVEYCPHWSFDPIQPTPTPASCELWIKPTTGITNSTPISVEGKGIKDGKYNLKVYKLPYDDMDGPVWGPLRHLEITGGGFTFDFPDYFGDGDYEVRLHRVLARDAGPYPCRGGKFSVGPDGTAPTPVPICPQYCKDLFKKPHPDNACRIRECHDKCVECTVVCPDECRGADFLKDVILCYKPICQENCLECGATPEPTTPVPELETLCTGTKNYNDCINCVRGEGIYAKSQGGTGPGIWTALGCIPTDISAILKDYIFTYGLGIAGGIAFLLMLFGGFTIMVSTGNPEKVAQGKEMITSALTGLLIIIFSVFILRLIGVDILRIPGFK